MTLLAPPAIADTCIAPDQLHVAAIDKPFTQDRTLSGIDKPLKSSGELKLAGDRLSWHMKIPFDVDTVITPEGITQSIDGGPAQPVGDAAAFGPAIARLFANVLQGRWSELESVFQVSRKPVAPGAAWTVTLRPIDPKLQQAFGEIEIAGCQDITTISISHQNGDHERISFEPGGAATP